MGSRKVCSIKLDLFFFTLMEYIGMFSSRNKGFTLIEIVLVLVLMGILSAVAVSKYYDLKSKAEYDAAVAYANQFSSEMNGRVSELLLEGKTCVEAQKIALSEITPKYWYGVGDTSAYIKNPNNFVILPYWQGSELENPLTISVANSVTGDTYNVPGGVIACHELKMKDHSGS